MLRITERSVPLEHFYFLDGQLRLAQNADGQREGQGAGLATLACGADARARRTSWRMDHGGFG